jgi:hypothetical protein
MRNLNELKKAIENKIPLVWNDPDPIEGANYNITYIEPLTDDIDEDTPILIHYGEGSEAQVYLHEILVKTKNEKNGKTTRSEAE